MIYDLQKAGIGKRISAFLLDFILMITLAVGVACAVSYVLDYDAKVNRAEELWKEYSAGYDFDLNISDEDYDKLSEEDKQAFSDIRHEYLNDEEVNWLYALMQNYILIIFSISPLISCLILELIVPLLLKNGQTIGKKIFGVGVVMRGGIRITGVALFARSILGKYAIETAIPILGFLMIMATPLFTIGAILLMGVLVINTAMFLFSKNHTAIHDAVSYTVCVDISSQLIFNSEEELIAYKNRIHAEANDAGGADY